MITILHAGDPERWLRDTYDDLVALRWPYSAEGMTVRGPVFTTRAAK